MLAGLHDTFYQALMTHNDIFGSIIDIVCETMPRDNLLNSACLELFEYIKRATIKPFIIHVVENYYDKLESITYVDTFRGLILRYEQMQGYGMPEVDSTLFSQQETPTRRVQPNGQRWQGFRDMDTAEEEYFNTSDDEEEVCLLNDPAFEFALTWILLQTNGPDATMAAHAQNGSASPVVKPLVDYPDDDEDDVAMDTKPEAGQQKYQGTFGHETLPTAESATPASPAVQAPPGRLSEKRRREEEDEDELGKLTSTPKRRSSSAGSGGAGFLRGKRSMSFGSTDKGPTQGLGSTTGSAAPKRIAINIGLTTAKPSPTDSSSAVTDPARPTATESGERDTREGSHTGEGE
jgi:protein phosphatase-4 regulatory subunit 3